MYIVKIFIKLNKPLSCIISTMNIFKKIYNYWIKFGDILGRFTSKITISIIFFALFTPISIFLKLIGREPLDKAIDNRDSYWVERDVQPTTMRYQF